MRRRSAPNSLDRTDGIPGAGTTVPVRIPGTLPPDLSPNRLRPSDSWGPELHRLDQSWPPPAGGSPQSSAHREEVLAAVTQDGMALAFAQDIWRADPDVVMAAVGSCGLALAHAAESLRADRQVVLAACRNDPQALWYATEAAQSDKDVVMAAVTGCGSTLSWSSNQLKGDREVVLAAVRSDGLALEHADALRKADQYVVRIAVRQNGMALQHASEQLRDDKQVVLEAVRQNGLALAYASEGLRTLVSATVDAKGCTVQHAIEALMVKSEGASAGLSRQRSRRGSGTVAPLGAHGTADGPRCVVS